MTKRRSSDRSRTQQIGSGQRRTALLLIINGLYKGEANAGAKAVVCDLRMCHSYYRQRPFASPSCICILSGTVDTNEKTAPKRMRTNRL